jgi:hypothetical protein
MKKRHKIIEHKQKIISNQGMVMLQCKGCGNDYIGYCMAIAGNKPINCFKSPNAGCERSINNPFMLAL